MNENLENKMRELCSVNDLEILQDMLEIIEKTPERRQKDEIQTYVMRMRI